ncbi:excinuclease ABC subunit UvrC [Thermospira aquatica]|uniref:UvrABC system protein C n=1 Tax=Thermospira aquatica TaxID=2828656 RepID=A0AAX3BC95_9SPIR|nr:excinuclease ABC subunit UvrC [Thermospira aquatica]URA09892.1 excinuclease ABC subunit UvrC [Thermospira aquatica]
MENTPGFQSTQAIKPTELHLLPELPGVYLMKDTSNTIIYIGKAINLRKRVSSYFQKDEKNIKTATMVSQIHEIDYIITQNETEALLLEANLIKHHQPKYNVVFKDNKFYPFIKITIHERFPRVVFSRDQKKDQSLYFGPYTSAAMVREYIDMIQRLFQIRTCRELPKRECLNYHIHRCSAPCIQKVTEEEYRQQVENAIRFLQGEYQLLVKEFEEKMREAAKNLLFEKAQIYKERIQIIRNFEETQSVYLDKNISADFIEIALRENKAVAVVSLIRNGKMIGKKSYSSDITDQSEEDILEQFIISYCSEETPPAIVLDKRWESLFPQLQAYFNASQKNIPLHLPSSREEHTLLKLAQENALLHLMQLLSRVEDSQALHELQEILELDTLPMRIEGFDIANLLGEQAVASLVSFYGGKPDKSNYRHYKIRTKSTPDDFAMIYEAVHRRYKRLVEEKSELPDLVLIDGGKGQLNAALSALADLGLSLNVVSLAKKNEEIYTPYRDKPIILPKNSPALHVLQRVRDETHRFANTFYNRLKNKSLLTSLFDGIVGIGIKRKKILIQKLMSQPDLHLSAEDLIAIGIPPSAVDEVLQRLQTLKKEDKEP